MGKGEEYLAKKRNKATRKRLKNTVDFMHGVQAAKRRRKAGRRRVCEGMCYSLPTPDDPFNDLYQKRLLKGKKRKLEANTAVDTIMEEKITNNDSFKKAKGGKASGRTSSANLIHEPAMSKGQSGHMAPLPRLGQSESNIVGEKQKVGEGKIDLKEQGGEVCASVKTGRIMWRPSIETCYEKHGAWSTAGGTDFEAYLCAFTNAGHLACLGDLKCNTEKRKNTIASKCDWQFWEACGIGLDVLATGIMTGMPYEAVYALAAAVHVAAKRSGTTACQNPSALLLVDSAERTLQIRKVCKLLKPTFGMHSICLHTRTSVQHQIEGLSSCDAEIVIATPERLCELLDLKAVSISNVSFMVLDKLEDLSSCGFCEDLQKIRTLLDPDVQTAIISDSISFTVSEICRQFLKDPISRVSFQTSLVTHSACITQDVSVIVSEDKRLQKLCVILRQHFDKQQSGAALNGVLVLFQHSQSLTIVKSSIETEGFAVGCLIDTTPEGQQETTLSLEQFREGQVEVLLSTEEALGQINVASVATIILYEFPSSITKYCEVLTGMARHTVAGVLHSFCSGATAPLAPQLVEVMEQCLQPVPSSLNMLAKAARVIEQQQHGL